MSPISTRLEILADLHHRSPLDLLEWFIERAAIIQYDTGVPRAEAERRALECVEAELEGRS